MKTQLFRFHFQATTNGLSSEIMQPPPPPPPLALSLPLDLLDKKSSSLKILASLTDTKKYLHL